jgi:hypothetical protein
MSASAKPRPLPIEEEDLYAGPVPTNPEFGLLVSCCADDSSQGRIRTILTRPLDWDRLMHLMDHHRVVPQVYGALSREQEFVPDKAFAAIRSRYQQNAQRALWFTNELGRLVSALESAGIKALPYKGPALAQTLYGDATQRQFSDLDVLVAPADIPRAKAVLLSLGYECGLNLSEREERAYIASGYEYVFDSAAGRNLLELQWRILPRFYSVDFDTQGFLERRETVSLAGHSFKTLSAQDLLLVLSVHAAKHVWVQLSWLCDIAQLVKSHQLDWDAIQDEAKRLGIERIVKLNLFLAQRLLGATLPPAIQERLRGDPSATVLADEILRIIERSVHYDTESIPYFRLMMRLRERWQDQARFLWRLAFTPGVSEWSAVRLPKPLHPLYHVVRLGRLARRLVSAG